MKYTPLDLSFLNHQANPSVQNTAAMIMANAGWSKPTLQQIADTAKAQKAADAQNASMHKQSFLSSVFDALQTPLYTVANSLDKALAGHQESSNDSVLSDIVKTAEGAASGAVKGYEAGARGATGMLDILPGVNISDDWQSNPANKTHFSDVAIRQETGMSTADAMKPENWAKVKEELKKVQEKPQFSLTGTGKSLFDMLIPDNLDSPEAQQKYLRNETLAGIPADILGDPLNFMTFGGGATADAAKAAKSLTEGLDSARALKGTGNAILSGMKPKNVAQFAFKSPEASPIQALPEGGAKLLPQMVQAPKSGVHQLLSPGYQRLLGIDKTAKPVEGILPEVADVVHVGEKGNFKTLANLGQRTSTPIRGLAVSKLDQTNLVKRIVGLARSGDKGWTYKAADLLRQHPNVDWAETEKLIQHANQVIKNSGPHAGTARLATPLANRITQDVINAKNVVKESSNERRVLNNITDVSIRQGPGRLKQADARLANQVVRKFEGEILGKGRAPGTGEGLARAIASGNNVRYSGPQQARMWNQITSNLKYADSRKFDKATKILRAVEDYFYTKGMIPHSAAKTAESVPLRLSQVAEAIGPQMMGQSHAFITGILRGDPKALAHLNPDQIEAIRNLRAQDAIAAAPAVQRGIDAGKSAADLIANSNLSAGRAKDLLARIPQTAKLAAAASGSGDAGAHVAESYVKNLIGQSDPVNSVLTAHRIKTEAWLSKVGKSIGKADLVNDPNFVKSVTDAITKASGLPSPKQLSGAIGAAAKVSNWLGARFNAAYGVQDMRPIFLQQQASAMSTTARRAALINQLAKKFPPSNVDLWHEAFKTAQENGIASGEVAALQSEIAKVMESLFGGTGLRDGAIADSTVVGRNRILMDELNKNLKRFGLSKYKFTDSPKFKTATGEVRDFSKGIDWLKSWEEWGVTKPYEFLHKIQNVVEFTVREKNMFDDMISRFASPAKNGDVRFGVNHPRLRGFYFTQEGAKQAQTFVRMLEEVSTPSSKGLQHFDHVLSKLKAGLTIYGGMAGHQMTNLIGDTYYNWIAGVNNPARYEQAIKVMLSQKGRYGDFASLEKLTGPKALEQAMARSLVKPDAGLAIPAAGNKVVVTMQNGTKVTADMIYTAAMRQGILPSAKVLEDVTSDTTSVLDKLRPLGGRGQRAIHQISEVRDHIPRLAQFIDGIAKSKGSFVAAVESSARSVRKWHPDGLGLTNFERRVMKRVFPFYSWTRKAIPLAIESTLFNGPKVMAYPRLMEAIGIANGVDPNQAVTDPFPNDQMFPDWIRERGIGPIAGGPGNYSVINPSTPILDTLAQIGNPGQTALSFLNPMAKVPIEVSQQQTLGQKVPIQGNQGWADYFTKQIPVASSLGRGSGLFGVSNSTRSEGFPNWTNILNLLTGAKKVDTGKYQKSAQFDLRDYFKTKASQQGR